jgi:putative transposase
VRSDRTCSEDRRASRRSDDLELRARLKELASERRRFGYRRLLILLRREGIELNHKKLFRLHREAADGQAKRWPQASAWGTIPDGAPQGKNQRWSLKFVSDTLDRGRRFRILVMVDDFARKCLALVVDMQNGFVESLDGRLRNECLNEHLFRSQSAARQIIEEWRTDYNEHRPHTSLGGLTPNEFATRSLTDHNENTVQL